LTWPHSNPAHNVRLRIYHKAHEDHERKKIFKGFMIFMAKKVLKKIEPSLLPAADSLVQNTDAGVSIFQVLSGKTCR